MSDQLTFLMGKYEARFPTDRKYARNHHWVKPTEQTGVYRVGFTSYSVRLLLDVYFLDWSVDVGAVVADRQQIGEIESSKAVSNLYPPAAGTLVAFNEQLLADPSAINLDNYNTGWLYDLRTDAAFLDPADYLKLLETGWEDTQRLLKGQMNQ